jgi:hypothetical protein
MHDEGMEEVYDEGMEGSCEWMEGWCMMRGGRLVHDEGMEGRCMMRG